MYVGWALIGTDAMYVGRALIGAVVWPTMTVTLPFPPPRGVHETVVAGQTIGMVAMYGVGINRNWCYAVETS